MDKTERHFEWTKSRIVIAIFVFISLLSVWLLELNGAIDKALFFAASFSIIIIAFLIDFFFFRKKNNH
jgi:hypothetical protein